jgi:hypothetical protein
MSEEYKRISVTFDPSALLYLNSILKERRGETLEELAASDPYTAYRALRIGKLIYSQLSIQLIALEQDMSPEELYRTRIQQRKVVEDIMPDPITQQSEVTVSVWNRAEPDSGGSALGSQAATSERYTIFSFMVEPPFFE